MNGTYESLELVSDAIVQEINSETKKRKLILLYAFNGAGKTRLSKIIHSEDIGVEDVPDRAKVLSYNAFFEDIFTWNNETFTIHFNPIHDVITFIMDQGLENQITDNFQKITRSKIFPSYELSDGRITFSFAPGDERSEENIKISRGEESLFVWSIFYTVLEAVIDVLKVKEEDRETFLFNELKCVIIDDPVSSIDDTKLITMAIELINLINSSEEANLNFLITTHHALFFNVLHNEYKRNKKFETSPLLLSKHDAEFNISEQGDTPFAYHLVVKDEIQRAVDENDLKKYHFNLFRGLLEKTANFLGYSKYDGCISDEEDRKEILRLINLYSHGKLSDLESSDLPNEHKDLFKKVFNSFVEVYKWK